MLHVPYRGSWMPDLLAGQVQVVFSAISIVIDNIRTGKLRALAVTSVMRSDALPDVLPLGEFLPGYEAVAWYGLCGPRNTPTEVANQLYETTNLALADPKLKARLADLAVEPMPMRPVQLGKFIADETEKWGKVVRAARIKAG
jgi:tripartite-type tricarboxylate transporter receptor subunit TctC